MTESKLERSIAEVTAQLRDLGVEPGDTLVVHTAFRAVRPVEGGPAGLIRALQNALGPEGTLVIPSWTGDDTQPFDPAQTPANRDLGVTADTFWRMPGVQRSDHPFAFAASGPRAAQILADPLPLPPHRPESPIGRVYDLGGKVLLLGVNHDADTTIHLAEIIAGVPYRVRNRITILEKGESKQIEYGENDHCCERFNLIDDLLRDRGLQSEGTVGHAHARLVRSRDVVDVVTEQLAADLLFFLHPAATGCEECDRAWESIA
jgi:aminoglycoside N3'-acetyltransferase